MILGTAQLGMNYGVNNTVGKPDVDTAHAILSLAEKSGIRVLDTAAAYGTSEDVIGRYIATHSSSFDICTKLPINLTSSEREKVYTEVINSIRRLNVGSIWCCYLHCFEQFLDNEIMLQLEAVKNDGLVENVGVSIYTPYELQVIVDSCWDIDVVQIPVNVFSSTLWSSSAARAKSRGIKLFARSVYLQGLVFTNPLSAKAKQIGATEYLRLLGKLASEGNCDIASYCMGFTTSLDYIDDVLIGCETLRQLKENILLTVSCPTFSCSDIEEVQKVFNNVPQSVINPSLWPKG